MIWNSLAPKQSFNRREALIVRVFFEFSSITLRKQFAGEALFCAVHSPIGTQSTSALQFFRLANKELSIAEFQPRARSRPKTKAAFSVLLMCSSSF